jgi:rSAM/selenodomain-associated transferase 2
MLRISVIVPVLNEAENLKELLPLFAENLKNGSVELIVVDGGSTDRSYQIAKESGATVLESKISNRSIQMNLEAKHAKGEIFYFVHADTRIFPTFYDEILIAVKKGIDAGCFAYDFDSQKRMLKINAWFTQFNGLLSGGGDQSLFIKREIFEALGGFDESFCLMEDFELVRRIKKNYSFTVIPKRILVSARKYDNNSWLRVQIANLSVFTLFFLGHPSSKLKRLYARLLK